MEASKFLRIGGRGDDGTAKPIQTDNEGNLLNRLGRNQAIEKTVFDSNTSSGTSDNIDVTGLSNILLEVDFEGDPAGERFAVVGRDFEGNENTVDEIPILDFNGNVYKYISKSGSYRVDVSGLKFIRLARTAMSGVSLTVKMTSQQTPINIDRNAYGAYRALYHEIFPDPVLRAALSSDFDVHSLVDAILYGQERDFATTAIQLDLRGYPIRDFSGIEYMINLPHRIRINGNDSGGVDIEKIPPITELTRLTIVLINNTNISFLGDFRFMKNLKQLSLSGNSNLTYIGDLSDLENLENISINLTSITSVDLTGLTNLEFVQVNDSPCTSVGDLTGLSSLETFRAQGSSLTGDVGNTSTLTGLTNQWRVEGCQFSQSDLEDQIDGFHAIRSTIGPSNPTMNFSGNPGSSGAAASRSTEISELESAGVTVTI